MACRRAAAVGKPLRTGTAEKKSSQGGGSLSKAASKTIEKCSAKIATSLLKRTLDGDAPIAKLLVALAEGTKENEETTTKPAFHSMARELAGEPQWVDEGMEGLGETGFGGQEPED